MTAAGLPASDIRRLLSSTGTYAAAAVAQRAVGFLLIPVYTRLIDPAEYGILEIFAVFSSIAFAFLSVGLPSAINKCYHRDCGSPRDQATVLTTALAIDLPILLGGCAALMAFARPLSQWLLGRADAADLFVLVVVTALLFGLTALLLANLRAQERAAAFSLLSLLQFVTALGLNIVLVVVYEWGIHGVLWGNLLSNAVMLPAALLVASRRSAWTFNRRLVGPLVRFGALLIPVTLAAWAMDLSDRYVLRLYRDLSEVAVYGVGYKFGMILELAVVWPFQLAWPAFAFSISNRAGHEDTYARAMTYLVTVLAFCTLMIALLTATALPSVVGDGYRDAYRVVPLVAVAYACNGIQYCVAPGVHITGNTRYLTLFSGAAAVLNLGLNFALIPRFGMMGAAWSTVAAFLLLAVATATLSQRVHPVPYEYARLAKIPAAAALAYLVTTSLAPPQLPLALAWTVAAPTLVFTATLALTGFLDPGERRALRGAVRRLAPMCG